MFSSTEGSRTTRGGDHGEQAHRFADGELAAAEAAAFEVHLADCEDCQEEIGTVLLLRGRIAELRSLPPPAPRRWWRRRRVLGLATGVAVAGGAALMAALLLVPDRPPAALARVFEESSQRPLVERLTYEPAARYRRPPAVMRSARLAAAVPIGALTAARAEGDLHGELALWLWAGDTTEASAVAARLPAEGSLDHDLAVDLAVLAMRRSRLDEARELLDRVLAADPSNAAALWNRALLAERQGDRTAAVHHYRAVSALQESGWADEARERIIRLSPSPSPSPSPR